MAHAPDRRPAARPPRAHHAPGEPPLLAPDELPRHVAIIMDGNRRWARERGLTDFEGHAAGVEAVRTLLQHAVRRGIPRAAGLRVQGDGLSILLADRV